MYVKDGIAYAGSQAGPIKVLGVRALEDFQLWVRFSTGEAKVIDFKPLLKEACFAPLRDRAVFRDVYIDYGCTVWADGDIDIAPEYLYENGEAAETSA